MRRNAASIRIQKHARTHSARKSYLQMYESAIVIQTGLRAMAACNEHRFRRETKASIIIQVCSIINLLWWHWINFHEKQPQFFLNRNKQQPQLTASFIISRLDGANTKLMLITKSKKELLWFFSACGEHVLQERNFESSKWFVQLYSWNPSYSCVYVNAMSSKKIWNGKQEARETGALKEAKDKLEKRVEELTWRLDVEKHLRVIHCRVLSVLGPKWIC